MGAFSSAIRRPRWSCTAPRRETTCAIHRKQRLRICARSEYGSYVKALLGHPEAGDDGIDCDGATGVVIEDNVIEENGDDVVEGSARELDLTRRSNVHRVRLPTPADLILECSAGRAGRCAGNLLLSNRFSRAAYQSLLSSRSFGNLRPGMGVTVPRLRTAPRVVSRKLARPSTPHGLSDQNK